MGRFSDYFFGASVNLYEAAGFPSLRPVNQIVINRPPAPISNGNGGEKWNNGLSRSGQAFNIDHFKMMLNARRAYHDSPQGRSIVDTLADSAIGPGLKYESAIKFEELGITQEDAQRIGAQLESGFDLWAKSKMSSRDGSMNFYQAQRLYLKCQIRDGETFTRLYYNAGRDALSPLQVGFIDPTQIMGSGFTTTAGPFNFDDGIKRDSQGREIAYKISVQDEASPFRTKIVEIPAELPRSRRKSMLHGYIAEYPGQKRGYSHIGHILQELQMLKDFELATLAKAEAQSKIFGFTLPSKDADSGGIFDDIAGARPAGPLEPAEYEGVENTQSDNYADVFPIPEATISSAGSMYISNLSKGEKLEFAPNTAPGDNLKEFTDSVMSYLSPSVKVPIEVLKMLWGQSYSASRATLLQFQEIKEFFRQEVAADFLDPVFVSWVESEVALGRISLPGFSDPRLKAAWINSRWIGSGVPNIDPVKMANASKLNLALSLTTGERESKNLNGSSYQNNVAKNKKDFENQPVPYWERKEVIND